MSRMKLRSMFAALWSIHHFCPKMKMVMMERMARMIISHPPLAAIWMREKDCVIVSGAAGATFPARESASMGSRPAAACNTLNIIIYQTFY